MNKIIVIVGPTGVGKTKLSIELAKKYNGEVINFDSTQVYKGLDIATAKVTESEKEGITHHLFDIKNIMDNYTVYDYQKDCRTVIDDVLKRGKTPILVGGTGLYIKAVLYDYKFSDEPSLSVSYIGISNEELYSKLLQVDPDTDIHPNNRKRVERALNYYEIYKEPFSKKGKDKSIIYPSIIIGLTTDRDNLYERINKRVDKMVDDGLLIEAKKIYDSNIRTKAVLTPIGYKELFPYFDGISSLEECLDLIKRNSRRYAKRQYTWFLNQMNCTWFNVDYDNFTNTILEVENYLDKNM